MLVELTITDERDVEHIRHLLQCDQHGHEFDAWMRGLLRQALMVPPPAKVAMVGVPLPDRGDE